MAGDARGQDDGWTPERSVAGTRNPWSIVAVISIATFMTVLDTSIANVALNHIAGGLAVSYDEATWVTTSFLVSTAIIIPISGWLADVIGRKRYYMISVALFTLASFFCGIAPNLTFLILARVVQGAAGGGLASVEQSMLVDTFPPRQRGMAFAAYGIVVIVGPVVGPILGGLITDNASWHWCFLINVPVGALSLFLVNLFVDEPEAMRREREERVRSGLRVDVAGFVLVALFLGCLEVTLDRGQRDDWFSSPSITATAIISALALFLFLPWELTRKDPIVPIAMYGRRNFGIANIFMLILGLIVFGSTQFIPQLLQQVLGYTATDAGLALTAGGLATIVAMPLSGVLSSRVDARILVGLAFALQGVAMWNMSHLDTQLSFESAAFARMLQSVGLPFLFVPLTSVAYVGLQPGESNQASALMNVARNLGGTIGISSVQTMLAQRSQVHQARLVETLNPLNPNYTHGLTQSAQALQGFGQSQLSASQQSTALLYRSLGTQAQMLSYVDVFHTLMIVVLAVIPLLLLMQGGRATGGAGAPG
ncbi:MAG TPA: DHA2 family efflux MFS transporter permease subunit [Caulobacteraceae bacterium]|jgi:DHA2 family multidrug resistance protein|nr:DHA2 family efflux MFS transporter permease subunit [Caulobacteraceae bacterium]